MATKQANSSTPYVDAGPRATPALSGGRVHAFAATGILNALDAGSAAVVWSRTAALKQVQLAKMTTEALLAQAEAAGKQAQLAEARQGLARAAVAVALRMRLTVQFPCLATEGESGAVTPSRLRTGWL